MHNDLVQLIQHIVHERRSQLIDFRRHLHVNPEPSGHEYQTTKWIVANLEAEGIPGQPGADGTGVIAEYRHGETTGQNPIAVRADIDAILIQDMKDVAYRSRVDGVMHACGHDVHTSALMGAVFVLKEIAQSGKLPFGIHFRAIFQPAEETARGAKSMVAAGAVDDVDGIFAIHVDPSRRSGQVGLRPGLNTAYCDEVLVTVKGRGGHAARPHEANDPVAALAQLINLVYSSLPRGTDCREPCVVTFGKICGGNGPNIIPDEVKAEGTLRTLDTNTRLQAKQLLKDLAKAIEVATDTHIDLRFGLHVPAVDNNPHLTEIAKVASEQSVGVENVKLIPKPSMGGEDFAYYLQKIPGALIRVGSATSSADTMPLHSSMFDVDEESLGIAASIFAFCVLNWFDPERK